MATNVPASSSIVLEVLTGHDNYLLWSSCIKNYLLAQDLWDVIEQTTKHTNPEDAIEFKAWRKKNAAALHAIQISCSKDIRARIEEDDTAKSVWDGIAELYKPKVKVPAYRDDLSDAVRCGNWTKAMALLDRQEKSGTRITKEAGTTALRLAIPEGQTGIVKKLVELMSEEDLAAQDNGGLTALSHVAAFGNCDMAECILGKDESLISHEDGKKRIPVLVALEYGIKELARYLYDATPLEVLEKDTYGPTIIALAINGYCFDIALHLLQHRPELGLLRTMYGTSSPLLALAHKPFASWSGTQLVFWKRCIYNCISVGLVRPTSEIRIHVQKQNKHQTAQGKTKGSVLAAVLHWPISSLLKLLGIPKIYEMKVLHDQVFELLHQMCKAIRSSPSEYTDDIFIRPIFMAVQAGNVDFVANIARADHGLLRIIDFKSRNIFSSAVLYRQAKIFSLIYGLPAEKALLSTIDESGNTVLHFAGILEPSINQLDPIPGAALQMQRELQWFKEVERLCNPFIKVLPNKLGKTPREVFTENHKKMVEDGEKWMKETASSCTVVGALIVTIMFAAAFTLPGGNNQNTGFPMFSGKELFMLFILSDSLSLFSSSTSALLFLGILTSRYAEDNFLESLPKKMIIGLSSLFFSIATMMIAFCAALFLMLPEQSWTVIPVIFLACLPVILFVFLQFRLLVDMFNSTYRPSIFKWRMKHWPV